MEQAENDFLRAAQEAAATIVQWRRAIHENPELGFAEHRTAALIATELEKMGLPVTSGVAGTGVVGLLAGGGPGRVIAIRADMDALPLQEMTGLPFASRQPGLMHACGHDAHVAMSLGAAMLLSRVKEDLPGQVKFVFQPCEETPPGGARAMLAAGVLSNPPVDCIVALHVNPHLPAGMVGYKEGTAMAAADQFTVRVLGQGGHGSSPHQGVDAVVVAAAAVQALQTIVSREINPLEAVVITVGTIHGGQKSNILADRVEFSGTVRTLTPEMRQRVPQVMRRVLEGVAAAHRARIEMDYEAGYPPLVNDPQVLQLVVAAAEKVVSRQRLLRVQHPAMGSEDFAFFAEAVPAAHFDLGVARKNNTNYPWHHSHFDLEEAALPAGAAVLAQIAWDYLHGT
ncbi:MAG: amidohydrolase [Clostridia bacterium]|nr:MAG: amidohydrolase [Clostridia bacterium]